MNIKSKLGKKGKQIIIIYSLFSIDAPVSERIWFGSKQILFKLSTQIANFVFVEKKKDFWLK